jgi:hypothetical protein
MCCLVSVFEDQTLYQLFVNSLKDVLGLVPSQQPRAVEMKTAMAASITVQQIRLHNRLQGREDCLLQINFKAIFSSVFTQKVIAYDPYNLR